MTEFFDAVLAEVEEIARHVAIHYPEADDALHDQIMQVKARLQSAHDAEVAEVRESARHEAVAMGLLADRAVGLLREIPSVLAYAMNLCNSQASEALQDESARQINSCNARIREVLSEQAGERENGDG